MLKIKKERLLITPNRIKSSSPRLKVIGTLNPGAVRLPNGKIVLYVRVIEILRRTEDEKYMYAPRMTGRNKYQLKIDRFNKDLIDDFSELDMVFKDGTKRLTFISHLRRVVLDKTGFRILSIDKKPSFYGLCDDGELGIEDPRITKIEDKYIMTYVSLSRNQNIVTSLAISDDCLNWKREGIIFGEQDKDVVIFPEKVNGKYVAFDRPEGNFQFSMPHIWIAFSSNLKAWGKLKSIDCVYEEGGTCVRNGAGHPPIKTKKGWLLIYHAVIERIEAKKEGDFINEVKKIIKSKSNRIKKLMKLKKESVKKIPVYSAGAALFDLNKPEKMIAKTKNLIIVPNEHDNGTFEEKKVVFPTGLVMGINGKDVLIYSGGGDIKTTVRKISLNGIMKCLKRVK